MSFLQNSRRLQIPDKKIMKELCDVGRFCPFEKGMSHWVTWHRGDIVQLEVQKHGINMSSEVTSKCSFHLNLLFYRVLK